MFLALAKDENRHAKILRNKANDLANDLDNPEMLSEAKNVFSDLEVMKNQIKQSADQLDVYRAALENEKESIEINQKYLLKATDNESKKVFEYLIKQEENHYEIIDKLVTLISHSEEWVESAEFGIREEY